MRAAIGGEPRVDAGEIVVEHALEASRPSLRHSLAAEQIRQARGIVAAKASKRPPMQADVDVDHSRTPFAWRIGIINPCRLVARIRSLAACGIAAPMTFPS